MEIYKSKFIEIIFDADKSLMKFVWQKETNAMVEEEYKQEIEKSANVLNQHKFDYAILNNHDFRYAISPDLQEWTNELLGPGYAASGVKKFAIIESEDFIAQLSTEQTVEDFENAPHEVQFFSDEAIAYEWFGF